MKYLDDIKIIQIDPNNLSGKFLKVREYFFTKNKITVFANKLSKFIFKKWMHLLMQWFVDNWKLENHSFRYSSILYTLPNKVTYLYQKIGWKYAFIHLRRVIYAWKCANVSIIRLYMYMYTTQCCVNFKFNCYWK